MNQTKKTQASEADLVRELSKENSELRKKLDKLEKQLLSEKEQNRHSQDNFKNFFHSTIEFCWVLDEQGNIIAVNETVQKRLGYDEHELKGRSVLDVHPPYARALALQYVNEMLQAKRESCPLPVLCKDGSELPVETYVFPGYWDQKPVLFGISKDISKLKFSEEKYAKVVHSDPNIIGLSDLETGVYIDVNPAFYNVLGFTPDETIGHQSSELVHLNHETRDKLINKLKETGSITNEETVIYHKDGHPVHVLLSANIVQIQDKKYNLTIAVDISERKQKENDLRESENRYHQLNALFRLMADTVPDLLWAKNLNKEFIFVNQAMCTTLLNAVSTREPLGKTDMFFALRERNSHPDEPDYHTFGELCVDSDRITLEQNKAMAFQEYGNVQGKFLCLDVHKAPLFDANGQLAGIVGSARDVTESKEQEAKLIESENKFKTVADFTYDWVYWRGNEGELKYMSPSCEQFTGYPAQAFLDNDELIMKVVHPDDQACFTKHIEQTHELDLAASLELRILKKDGSTLFVEHICRPVYNNNGQHIGRRISNRDITERKIAETELMAAKLRAEESDKLKSAFLANMSHEIRTPMNGILGFAELLKETEITNENHNLYLSIIEKSGKRMLNIINDIIDISKIEAGLMTVDKKESNINDQIEYIYTFFKPEVHAKGIAFSFRNALPSREAVIFTDREKVFAILTNLVKNAIKYTEEGFIELGYTLQNDYLELYVSDSGIGIPNHRQKAVFERFIQADSTTEKAKQGAGLGLSITKAYVEMLGGNIRLTSEAGKGSVFSFTLPYEPLIQKNLTSDDAAKHHFAEAPPQAIRLTVLIVEDDPISETLLDIHIRKLSKKLFHARNGIDAIEICRLNTDIDLILMDIRLPDINGYEATKQIRAFNNKVIVIAQTAYGLQGDREAALEAGCNDYITKPINRNELEAMLKKLFY